MRQSESVSTVQWFVYQPEGLIYMQLIPFLIHSKSSGPVLRSNIKLLWIISDEEEESFLCQFPSGQYGCLVVFQNTGLQHRYNDLKCSWLMSQRSDTSWCCLSIWTSSLFKLSLVIIQLLIDLIDRLKKKKHDLNHANFFLLNIQLLADVGNCCVAN